MKKIATKASYLLLSALCLTSCLGEEEVTELSSTVALLTFSLDDMKTTRTRLVDGRDTTYTYTTPGSIYRFGIDHVQRRVENADSIAFGTNVKVTANVTADGYIYYDKAGERVTFSADDSIDFSQPVTFTIVSEDGAYSRGYTVKVNVEQQDPARTYWRMVGKLPATDSASKVQKALVKGGRLYVFATTETGIYQTNTAIGGDGSWTAPVVQTGIDGEADCCGITIFGGSFCLLTDKGLYTSVDGGTWTPVLTSVELDRLIGVSEGGETAVIWGVSGGMFAYSSNMTDWELTEQEASCLPQKLLSTINYPLKSNPKIGRTLFIGMPQETADTCAQVWAKLTSESVWDIVARPDNDYACPLLENLAVIRYCGNLYAFGGRSLNRRDVPVEAFGKVFESLDNGITWKVREEGLNMHPSFVGREESFTAVTDEEGYLWIIWTQSGEVWKGIWKGRS